jgi:hypothetical protein
MTPKKRPPDAQPSMKIAVARPLYQVISAGAVPAGSSSFMAGPRARTKIRWSMVSNIHPSEATIKTHQ